MSAIAALCAKFEGRQDGTSDSPDEPKAKPKTKKKARNTLPHPKMDAGSANLTQEKEAALLPPSQHVTWFQKNSANTTITHLQRWAESGMMPAINEWLIDVITHSYLSKDLKTAGRRLLAARAFTPNMEHFQIWEPFKKALHDHLVHLGEGLAVLYKNSRLGERLGNKVISPLIKRHPTHTEATTQDAVLPAHQNYFKWDHYGNMDEQVYLLVLSMTAMAVDNKFQGTIEALVSPYLAGEMHAFQRAPPKSYPRMKAKMLSGADHRYRQAPRGGNNADVIRNLVACPTVEDQINAMMAVSDMCGGVVKIKNLFDLDESDRAQRHHLLSTMIIVMFDAGITYGDLAADPASQALWDAYAEAPAGEPKERWARMTAKARGYLSSPEMRHVQVNIMGEIQFLQAPYVLVRHQMHEVYKAERAQNGVQLHEDFEWSLGQSSDVVHVGENEAISLYQNCFQGNADSVKALIEAGPSVLPMGLGAAYNQQRFGVRSIDDFVKDVINLRDGGDDTPLIVASELGHTDVVEVLLNAKADPNIRKGGQSLNGSVALHHAALRGHTDIIKLLVEASASVNTQCTQEDTALFLACQPGWLDTVTYLLDAKADVDLVNNHGRAAINTACCMGHADVAKLLMERNCDVNIKGNWGTPLQEAIDDKQPHIAALLRAAGAVE